MERAHSASVESIPEVLEDRDLLADQSDSASVHDMDYVNPRGVRFTQSTQKEGKRNSFPKILYFKAQKKNCFVAHPDNIHVTGSSV